MGDHRSSEWQFLLGPMDRQPWLDRPDSSRRPLDVPVVMDQYYNREPESEEIEENWGLLERPGGNPSMQRESTSEKRARFDATGDVEELGEVRLDLEERPYVDSDDDVDYRGTNGRDVDVSDLPSHRMSGLAFPTLNAGIRNRRHTTHGVKKVSRKKSHIPTQVYHEWRKNPSKLDNEFLASWRENDQTDMDTGVAEEVNNAKRTDGLRDMTIGLSQKKRLLKSIKKSVTLQREGTLRSKYNISCWKNMQYSWALRRMHMKKALENAFRSVGLWQSHLKLINSNFGTDVTAYFLFLRWLFVANAGIGLLILLFLFVPQMFHMYMPQDASAGSITLDPVVNASGLEFLIGGINDDLGLWKYVAMFYGQYGNDSIDSIAGTNQTTDVYDMKMAYLFSQSAYFVVYFLVIAISAAKSYRKNFIESNGRLTFQYVLKILDGWDYNIDAQKTARMKTKNLYIDFKEYCASVKGKQGKSDDCCDYFMLTVWRLAAVIMQLVVISGCATGVYFTVLQAQVNGFTMKVWNYLLPPLVISIVNTIVPFIFSLIAFNLKFRNPKSAVYMTLAMTMLLYGVTLFIYFGMTMLLCQGGTADPFIASLNLNENATCPTCWESRLGEQAYSLVVIDFLIGVVVTLLSEVAYRICTQFCCNSLTHPQFDIARNTMAIIYNQFVLWLGIYFGPLLTVIAVIKLFFIFWIKRVTVVQCCIPTTKPWRAAKMHTIFLVLLFVGFICCAIMYGIVITIVRPSDACGPFAGQLSVHQAVSDQLTRLTGNEKNVAFEIIFSPGIVVALIVALCVVVHYVRVVSIGKRKLIKLLKIQIVLESKDRVYLHRRLKIETDKQAAQEASHSLVGGCTCDAAPCICHTSEIEQAEMDSIPELRPNQGRQRVFAKQRSDANLSDTQSYRGSRENLAEDSFVTSKTPSQYVTTNPTRVNQATQSHPSSYTETRTQPDYSRSHLSSPSITSSGKSVPQPRPTTAVDSRSNDSLRQKIAVLSSNPSRSGLGLDRGLDSPDDNQGRQLDSDNHSFEHSE